MKGKTALVTGSTSGIGLAMARAFAAQGCDVMLNGFGAPAEIAKLKQDMAAEFGVGVEHHGADMSKPAEIADLVASAKSRFGGVDVLVNNAGVQHIAPVDEFPPEKWDQVIAINLSSSFHTIRLALPMMRAAGWGRIINIVSVHGLVASVNKPAYVAAKHGLSGLTKAVALETAGQGITCNGICPGWTLTPLIQKQIELRSETLGVSLEDGARDLLSEKQPSKQFVKVEELAQTAVFLCSDAASQITGVLLPVDGGWTAQ